MIVTLVSFLGAALAQGTPEFKLGFRTLAGQIPHLVGEPLDDEHWGPNVDSLQQTTTGLVVWRRADNRTAFTNGARTWINGPYGLQERANAEWFPWERGATGSTSVATATRIRLESALGQVYTPQVKAMDEESRGSEGVVTDLMRGLDEEWTSVWGGDITSPPPSVCTSTVTECLMVTSPSRGTA